jgi:hypothetical protein
MMPAKKRTAKKTRKARRDPTSAIDAIEVAQSLAATSGFLNDKIGDDEILKGIVREAFQQIPDANISALIETTRDAVNQLVWDRNQPNKKVVADKYRVLSESAIRLAENLSAVLGNHALEGPFFAMFTLRPDSAEQIERLDRIRHHMIGDLFWLRSMIEPAIGMMQSTERIQKDPEYKCAFQIVLAWFTATGEMPTLTRNTQAVAGPQATSFQRFLVEAIPQPSIGDSIVRKVVAGVGELAAQPPLSEIPKGVRGT